MIAQLVVHAGLTMDEALNCTYPQYKVLMGYLNDAAGVSRKTR